MSERETQCRETTSTNPPPDVSEGKRRKETRYKAAWAFKKRLELITQLGGECVECGKKTGLEIDHKRPCAWDHSKKSRWQRVRIYIREAAAGLLQVLCKKCNKKKGNRRIDK